jgi:hypothetical protein
MAMNSAEDEMLRNHLDYTRKHAEKCRALQAEADRIKQQSMHFAGVGQAPVPLAPLRVGEVPAHNSDEGRKQPPMEAKPHVSPSLAAVLLPNMFRAPTVVEIDSDSDEDDDFEAKEDEEEEAEEDAAEQEVDDDEDSDEESEPDSESADEMEEEEKEEDNVDQSQDVPPSGDPFWEPVDPVIAALAPLLEPAPAPAPAPAPPPVPAPAPIVMKPYYQPAKPNVEAAAPIAKGEDEEKPANPDASSRMNDALVAQTLWYAKFSDKKRIRLVDVVLDGQLTRCVVGGDVVASFGNKGYPMIKRVHVRVGKGPSLRDYRLYATVKATEILRMIRGSHTHIHRKNEIRRWITNQSPVYPMTVEEFNNPVAEWIAKEWFYRSMSINKKAVAKPKKPEKPKPKPAAPVPKPAAPAQNKKRPAHYSDSEDNDDEDNDYDFMGVKIKPNGPPPPDVGRDAFNRFFDDMNKIKIKNKKPKVEPPRPAPAPQPPAPAPQPPAPTHQPTAIVSRSPGLECPICMEAYDSIKHHATAGSCGHVMCTICGSSNRCSICKAQVIFRVRLFFT